MNRSARWTELERYRVVNLLQAALTPAFLSFLGMGMSHYYQGDPRAWEMACLGGGLVAIAFVARVFHGKSKLSADDVKGLRQGIMYSLTLSITVLGVLQLIAVGGVFATHTFLLFYAGITLYMLTGAILFGVAIFRSRNVMAKQES